MSQQFIHTQSNLDAPLDLNEVYCIRKENNSVGAYIAFSIKYTSNTIYWNFGLDHKLRDLHFETIKNMLNSQNITDITTKTIKLA